MVHLLEVWRHGYDDGRVVPNSSAEVQDQESSDRKDKADRERAGAGGVGSEPEPPEMTEVAGRSSKRLITCPNCGATNLYDVSWQWVACWRCGNVMYP